jgi:hypothetical protein
MGMKGGVLSETYRGCPAGRTQGANDKTFAARRRVGSFVVLGHMALHLLKRGTGRKLEIKSRRKAAGWDENYPLEPLKGNFTA